MGVSAFGTMQSIAAVGALVGGLTLASMSRVPHKGRIMLITGIGYGLLLILLGGVPYPMMAFGIVIFIGASQTIFRTANNSTLLQITPRHLQGRVVSLTFLDMGVQSLAALLAGAVTDAFSVSVGLIVLGGICVGIVGFIGLGFPAIRRL